MKRNYIFIGLAIAAVGLVVAGFIVPPTGVIDGSVLTAVGELFAFGALAMVPSILTAKKGVTISRGNTTIKVDKETDGE